MYKEKLRILGIDPGYGRIGWGVVEGQNNNWNYIAHGCIETFSSGVFVGRLVEIGSEIKKLVESYKPHISAVEDLFFAKNVKTAMKVGHARGVIILTLAEAGLEVEEFTPLEVKQTLTGYGRAEKGQMQKMLQTQLRLKKKPSPDDAADALAVALIAGFSFNMKKKAG